MKASHFFYLCACAALAGSVVVLNIVSREPNSSFAEMPDENAAGLALLAQKQSGPGYFHSSTTQTTKPGFITSTEAHGQAAQVVQQRHWGDQEAAKISVLIGQMAQPDTNRSISSPQLNVMRLNLALDALH